MKNVIAITGSGGGVGQSIIKALYESDYSLVALDGEYLATGLYAVPKGYVIPYANKPDFIEVVYDICQKEKIDLLFPGMDAELMPLARNRKLFEDIGTNIIVSSEEVIEISDNKLKTFEFLNSIGINVPSTRSFDDYNINEFTFPVVIKPKIGGARSKNVFVIKNQNELDNLEKLFSGEKHKYIIQEYIEGDEYTCGTVNFNGKCYGIITMRRILRDGDTYKSFVEFNDNIEQAVSKIMQHLKPFGACNVQLRLKENKPYIIEINARCSGTTAARAICGFNEPKMIADYLLKGIEPSYNIKKLNIMRYWKEFIVDDNEILQLKEKKHISKDVFEKL